MGGLVTSLFFPKMGHLCPIGPVSSISFKIRAEGFLNRTTATLRTSACLRLGAMMLSACQPSATSLDHPYRSWSPK